MSNSPILQLPQVSPNQNQKEQTINDAVLGLENASQAETAWNFAAGDVTVTATQLAQAFFHRLQGASAARNFIVPNTVPRYFAVRNEGAFDITVKPSGGTGVIVPAGESNLLFASPSATEVFMIHVNPDTGQGAPVTAFTQLNDAPHSFTGQGGKVVKVKADGTGLEFVTEVAGASAFTTLTDVPHAYTGSGLKLLRVKADETGLEFVSSDGIPQTIRDLTDVPDSFTGMSGKVLIVKSDESGIDFVLPTIVTGGVSTFKQLTDVPQSYSASGGMFVRVKADGTGLEFVTAPTGVTTWLGLTDTPANYTGSAAKAVRVKADETGLEFYTPASAVTTLAGLSDVNVTEGAPIDGYRLTWNQATGKWIAAPSSGLPTGGTAGQVLAKNSTTDGDASWASLPYDLGIPCVGKPTSSEVIALWAAPRAVSFPASMTGSIGKAGTGATAQTDFTVQKNGVTVGTVRFAAGASTATFVSFSAWSVVSGDVVKVIAPASPDSTLADFGITLSGTR